MRTASKHVSYLINEGYDLKQAVTFVGNHFQLSERQRLALMRSISAAEPLEARKRREKPIRKLADAELWIDGFNTIITLEVMLSDSNLFLGTDGCIRDLAALRGTYRLIPETEEAVRILLETLKEAKAAKAHILLDEPVSNSGRLKTLIAERAEDMDFDMDILILRDVDRALYGKENVVTSDAVILDNCESWVNLTGSVAEKLKPKILQVW